MALSAARNTPTMGLGIPVRMNYPVLTSTTIYEGSLVCINSSGYAKPAVSETGDVMVGTALETVTNSGSSGSVTVQVQQGVSKWLVNGSAVTIADIGTLCYAYDDQTITKTSTSRSIAGTIMGVDSDGGAWVYTGIAASVDGTSLSALTSTVSQLTSNIVIPYTIPVVLSSAVTNAVVARFTPAMSGNISKIAACVIVKPTTADKLATLTPAVSGVALTGGGALALTTTNCATLGNSITGTTITSTGVTSGGSGFTSTQEITVVATSVTAFVEGQVLLELFLKSA